jgi:hypothetical protein
MTELTGFRCTNIETYVRWRYHVFRVTQKS